MRIPSDRYHPDNVVVCTYRFTPKLLVLWSPALHVALLLRKPEATMSQTAPDCRSVLRTLSFGQRIAEEERDYLAKYLVETDQSEATIDYPLENLDPERFQQLCQSLLVKEFPQVQCFPVAQPDGGRDAVSFFVDSATDKFMVFQIKFVRKPHADPDPHKWLNAIIDEEAPKVKDLIPRGAARYVLLTNIPGTAHLDRGSIDKLNASLKDKLGIPANCWWRDDINRRLQRQCMGSKVGISRSPLGTGLPSNHHRIRFVRAQRPKAVRQCGLS